jgi:hypothetical protein
MFFFKFAKDLLKKLLYFFAFLFGIGRFSKYFPAACVTLLAAFIYFPIVALPISYHFSFLLIILLIAILACQIAQKKLGTQTYPIIVLDKIFGYGVALLGARPLVDQQFIWQLSSVVLCFLVFRLFDCLFNKLKLKNSLDTQKNFFGLKIMAFNLLVGICAAIILLPIMLFNICITLVIDAYLTHRCII